MRIAPHRSPRWPLTRLLAAARQGNQDAAGQAFVLLYDELRRLARAQMRQRQTLTLLDTTSLLHESFLKLVGVKSVPVEDRNHFFAYASRVMRSVIVGFARAKLADRVVLDTELGEKLVAPESDVLRVHEALEVLAQADARLAQVVEMRYFGGMTRLIAPAWLALLSTLAQAASPPVVVGSKRFTESYVVGEIVRQTLQQAGVPAEHKPGLGNTGILEQALASGAVDVYPEYTGTIVRELLKRTQAGEPNPSLEQLNTWLAPRGLKAAVPLGFNNTQALAVRESVAERLALRSISDLARLTTGALQVGLSHEFQQRADGWPALRQAYGLSLVPGAALDHALAYAALEAGQADLIDVYSTDAQLGRRAVRVLVDVRRSFPRYDAVLLMRAAVDATPLQRLAGRLDEATMIRLNAQVEIDGLSFSEVARRFLSATPGVAAAPASAAAGARAEAAAAVAAVTDAADTGRAGFAARLFAPDLGRLLLQHLGLVFSSVLLAVGVGVPLGVWAWRRPLWAGALLGVVGVLQTVPSLALRAVLIAMLGVIGFVPALLALFVYALLPIVRNTHAGLAGVPAGLSLAGPALGLDARQVLREVQLPLAAPTLRAGAKTAAVINVGAGALGERIVAGLAVNDRELMLAGALPAALLAVVVQWAFDAWERRWLRRAAG